MITWLPKYLHGLIKENIDMVLKLQNDKADKSYVSDRIDERFEKYAECFKCGNLANKNRMKPLAVFESEVFNATSDREFVLNGYTMRMAMSSLSAQEKIRDDKTTTIYFCQHCKAELLKKKSNLFKLNN